MIDDIFYKKYLKYKSKYNNLKTQIGGSYDEDIKKLFDNGYNIYSLKNNMTDIEFKNKIIELNNYIQTTAHKENIILVSILNNFINDKQNILLDVKHLVGPLSLSIYKNENKTIYIFGEGHGDINTCVKKKVDGVNIVDFLDIVFKNSYSFIDFYVEIPLLKPNIESLRKKQIEESSKKRTLEGGGDLMDNNEKMDYILERFNDMRDYIYTPEIKKIKLEQSYNIMELEDEISTSDEYKLIRYHAIDIRQLNINDKDVDFLFLLYNFLNDILEDTSINIKYIKNINELIRKIIIEDNVKLKKILLEINIIDNGKLIYLEDSKLLVNPYSYFKDDILKYAYNHDYLKDDKLEKFKSNLNFLKIILVYIYILINVPIPGKNNLIDKIIKLILSVEIYKEDLQKIKMYNSSAYEFINNTKSRITKEIYNTNIYNLIGFLSDINTLRVDIYTLSRIFRRFEFKNRLTDRYEEYHTENPSNIIIYAGNEHADNYRNFLDSLPDNFNKIFDDNKQSANGSCLDISRVNIPLFQIDNLLKN